MSNYFNESTREICCICFWSYSNIHNTCYVRAREEGTEYILLKRVLHVNTLITFAFLFFTLRGKRIMWGRFEVMWGYCFWWYIFGVILLVTWDFSLKSKEKLKWPKHDFHSSLWFHSWNDFVLYRCQQVALPTEDVLTLWINKFQGTTKWFWFEIYGSAPVWVFMFGKLLGLLRVMLGRYFQGNPNRWFISK